MKKNAGNIADYGWHAVFCNFIDGALHLRADVFPFVSISCAGEYPFTVDAPYYDTADGIYGQ